MFQKAVKLSIAIGQFDPSKKITVHFTLQIHVDKDMSFFFISTIAKKNNINLQFSVPPAAEMEIKSSSSGYERH